MNLWLYERYNLKVDYTGETSVEVNDSHTYNMAKYPLPYSIDYYTKIDIVQGKGFVPDPSSKRTIGRGQYLVSGLMYLSSSSKVNRIKSNTFLGSDGERYHALDTMTALRGDVKGSFKDNVIAEPNVYPDDGKHTDGYWYIKIGPANIDPTITLTTTDNRTLYENDIISLRGNVKDEDSGDVVTVRYSINNGTTRAISSDISQGIEIPFNKTLTFKGGKLYDGSIAVTGDLAEGTQHYIKVWATDDQGGKSEEKTINFYVVPNRPPSLKLEPFTPATDLINTDKITIQGNAQNPDENGITVDYKIGNDSYREIYSSEGIGGDFSFQVNLSDLVVGRNTLTIRSTDYYGATDIKTLEITKDEDLKPLKTAVARYKLTPPNGTAKGIVLWIEREIGDLDIDVEVHMGDYGEPENFKPMVLNSTAYANDDIEEDEFTFENSVAKENIILKITMNRSSTVSNKGITLISGVLS